MPDTAIVRLSPIPLFGDALVPMGRIQELTVLLTRRREARGRCISACAMTGLSAFFTIAYGLLGSWIWMFNGPIILAVLAAIFCGGLFLATVKLSGDVSEELAAMRAATADAALLQDAEAQLRLAAAVAEFDLHADDWNRSLAAAEATDVAPRYMGMLTDAREKLQRRRDILADGVVQAWAEAAMAESPRPRELPPARDWGPVVRVDLKSP